MRREKFSKANKHFQLKKIDPQNLSDVQHARRLNSPTIVLTETQNEPKRAETSRNEQKRPKEIMKQPKTTQNFKIGKIWSFLLVFAFQISSPNAQIWPFCSKSINSLILTKFRMYPSSKSSELTLVFENFESESQNLDILDQKEKRSNFLILTKFCLYPISKVLISSLTFIFENFHNFFNQDKLFRILDLST